MPDFVDNFDLNDRQALVAFPDFVHDVVTRVLEVAPLSQRLKEYLRAAWDEILARGELDMLRRRLATAPTRTLADHGLLGAQLMLKRRALARRWTMFTTTRKALEGWVAKRLLSLLTKVMQSILDALGIGGLLREFLDVVTDAVVEHEDETL